jgi:hypothetical protein
LEIYVSQQFPEDGKLPAQLCRSQGAALSLKLPTSLNAGGSICPFLLKLTSGA